MSATDVKTFSNKITGNVLFSPNANDDRSTTGIIYMPNHILTIGQTTDYSTATLGSLLGTA